MDDPGAFVAAFASPAVYTAGGVTATIHAVIEDGNPWMGINEELRSTFNRGQVRLATAWVLASELPAEPAFGHTFGQDGRTWTVEDAWPEGGMLVLGLSLGVFVVDVTVQKDVEISDGKLGFKIVPTDIWTGTAAVLGLSGHERVAAARQVGVGYRHGWMPACADLAAGCRMVTPHEVLHVTDAYTDYVRGWTVFEAEARQEAQS